MKHDALTLIILFAAVFVVIMAAITGLNNINKNDNTNITDTQDTMSADRAQNAEFQEPFFLGLNGLLLILAVVLGVGVVGALIFKTFWPKRSRWG